MIFRRIFWILLFLPSILLSQVNNFSTEPPQVLPASPDAASFVKYGYGNVNMSTGAVTTSIPLYDLKIKDFSFPISLNYSSQGLKVDEQSSRVGMGWNISYTGVITRSVKGRPDELGQYYPAPSTTNVDSPSVKIYLENVANSSYYDTQLDEYQFNFNGHSGKFVINPSTKKTLVTATNNFVINVSSDLNKFTVIAPDGVIYKFGNNFEITKDLTIKQYDQYKANIKTAFFLDTIILVSGDRIHFNYNSITFDSYTGLVETLVKSTVDQQSIGSICTNCEASNSYSTNEHKVTYQSKYLTSISSTNGHTIQFNYIPRPDNLGDNRLKSIQINSLKNYVFEYLDTSKNVSTVKRSRYFLKRIRDIDSGLPVTINQSIDHIFEYYNEQDVPVPGMGGQDSLGFYNGIQDRSGSLIPSQFNSAGILDMSKRKTNPVYAIYGMLKTIKYPTGGTELFNYEPNTASELVKSNSFVNERVDAVGDASIKYKVYYSDLAQVFKNHKGIFTFFGENAVTGEPLQIVPGGPALATVKIYDGTSIIYSSNIDFVGEKVFEIDLLANHTYKIGVTIKDNTIRAYANLYYFPDTLEVYNYMNVIKPGLRIKSIIKTDSLTNSNIGRYFHYAALSDLTKSSGSIGGTVFKRVSISRTYCDQWYNSYTQCKIETYSSSSMNDNYDISGNGSIIYYNNVIESEIPFNGTDFPKGGTEYTFFHKNSGNNAMVLIGDNIEGLPGGQFPTLTGMVEKKKIFDSSLKILHEDISEYETLIDNVNLLPSYHVKRIYQAQLYEGNLWTLGYEWVKMNYGNTWIRLKKNTIYNFEGDGQLKQETIFNYGDFNNIQPTKITTINSIGDSISIEKKYPTDFLQNPTMVTLVNKNRISSAVEEIEKQNSVLIRMKKVNYSSFSNNVIAPANIQIKSSPFDSLKEKIIFDKYDSKSNILQLHKVGDHNISYIWDTIRSVPLCEVLNASQNEIAYCGFDVLNNWGGFTLNSGGPIEDQFAGYFSFSGSISKQLPNNKIYNITLWVKGNATVNGTQGETIKNANSWILKKWTFQGPLILTITGSLIDELRVYPQESRMTSFGYKDFIGPTFKGTQNNAYEFYSYDTRGRLISIKDTEGNILKKYCYSFGGEIDFCSMGNQPFWSKTTITRCKPCSADSTYLSNIQEVQEIDINPYSNTYNKFRWVSTGILNQCQSIPDWKQVSLTCEKNNQGSNTGYSILIEQDKNPCSSTYNNTRTIRFENSGLCPVSCTTSNCTGNDKKCINGACEIGQWVVVSCVYQKVWVNGVLEWKWVWTYKYCFSDGTYSTYSQQTYNNSSTPVSSGCGTIGPEI